MAVTNFSPLLGLALPTTGDLSGTWGTAVNDQITQLLDSAVAGTTTLSADADVTLSTTNGAANQARNAVILWTASNGANIRNITAPAQSKAYLVINSGTGSVVIRGAGPTTGVTLPAGARALVAWNGSDFVKIVSNPVVLTTDVSGTLPIANGGTNATSAPAARTSLGATTLGSNVFTITNPSAVTFPRFNADNTVSSLDAPAFRTAIGAGSGAGDVAGPASATDSALAAYDGTTGKLIKQAATVTVAQGGTGLATLTANNVIIGNGTSAPLFVAPGTSGNVLTSDGTTWASTAGATGDVTLAGTQTLTNKTIAFADNTLTGVVGTTATQTLTNKTISGADNTLTVDGTVAVGFRTVPQNSQSGAYTLVLADSGKHIFHPVADNNARTFTIPANSSVAYPIGTALTFINMAVANVTIAITTDTLTLSPAGTSGSRTLATNGSATCIKITATQWLISGSGLT